MIGLRRMSFGGRFSGSLDLLGRTESDRISRSRTSRQRLPLREEANLTVKMSMDLDFTANPMRTNVIGQQLETLPVIGNRIVGGDRTFIVQAETFIKIQARRHGLPARVGGLRSNGKTGVKTWEILL
jgi:hypothetical protein